MRTHPLAIIAAFFGASLAACASSSSRTPPPAAVAKRAASAGPADSIESICMRGDTTRMLVRNRRTGKRRLEQWLFTARGSVVDLNTGLQLMDSTQAASTGVRDLFRQQQELDARTAELTGKPQPVPEACTI